MPVRLKVGKHQIKIFVDRLIGYSINYIVIFRTFSHFLVYHKIMFLFSAFHIVILYFYFKSSIM